MLRVGSLEFHCDNSRVSRKRMSNVIEGVSCELYEKGGEDRGEDGEDKGGG